MKRLKTALWEPQAILFLALSEYKAREWPSICAFNSYGVAEHVEGDRPYILIFRVDAGIHDAEPSRHNG